MNVKNIFNKDAWAGGLKATGMKLNDAKPEIMVFTGLVSLVIGTIWMCTKTEEGKEEVLKYKEANATIKNSEIPELADNEKALKIEKGKMYVKNTGYFIYRMGKIYGGPILLWVGGALMVTDGHRERHDRYKSAVAELVATRNMFNEYRVRNAAVIGEEAEQKIFMGAKEDKVKVLERDPETGEEKIVTKKCDVFCAQPGSIFARNFTETTSDAFDIRSFADNYLQDRIDSINYKLEVGMSRGYTGLEILRMLGFNENALGEGVMIDALKDNGISANPRKVKDPEMRKLKVTKLTGYEKRWDPVREMEVYVPCLRLDFNFYPIEGMI